MSAVRYDIIDVMFQTVGSLSNALSPIAKGGEKQVPTFFHLPNVEKETHIQVTRVTKIADYLKS